ncbi:helix-turn-helix domain-containing protein [Bacillus cereus]|uniref:helix-turn-helix domain-containing protein n=1 Tax=Bacillus cereus TaxID=1396 RepID=UPI0020D27FC1|nr:helix-turn-helix domain-containing protein [Bacillus cereus]
MLLAYKTGEYTLQEICSKYKITVGSLKEWMKRFENYGMPGLQKSTSWKRYSKAVKEAAFTEYLSGAYSKREIIIRLEISSTSVLGKWIKNYNSHRGLKDMSKGRTTAL